MFFAQIKNFLPKKLTDRVALKTSVSQHQFSKFQGVLRKQSKKRKRGKLPKILLGGGVVLYLMGYQPTLAIPPLKEAIVKAEGFSQKQAIEPVKLSYSFNLPHPGYLSTHYSFWHQAVDIATGLGMPIRPVAPGKVIETSFGWWGLGHFVVVEHEQNFKSTYGHMGRIFVKKGDVVTSASILGEVGMTGHTSGPHTHLEIAKNDKLIDPKTILPQIPDWTIGVKYTGGQK